MTSNDGFLEIFRFDYQYEFDYEYDFLGTFRFDYEYEFHYEYDFLETFRFNYEYVSLITSNDDFSETIDLTTSTSLIKSNGDFLEIFRFNYEYEFDFLAIALVMLTTRF